VRHLLGLVLLLVALGWWTADSDWGAEPAPAAASGPQWRRTTDGWIKVGSGGASALDRPAPQRAAEPALHPGVVAAFMLLAGVLSLSLFDARPLVKKR
jgi:hypothetical protein